MSKKPTHQRIYGGVDAGLRETERRKKLLAAGLEAFGTVGYAKTNIKTICRIAGLTERYFYESFRNKEDLLSAVYRQIVDEQKEEALNILEENGREPIEAASKAIRMFFMNLRQDPHRAQVQLFEVMGVSQRIDGEYRDAMRLLAEMAKLFLCTAFPGIGDGAWKGSIVPTGLAGSIILIAHEWVLGGFVTPLENIIDQCTDLFVTIGSHLDAKSRQESKA